MTLLDPGPDPRPQRRRNPMFLKPLAQQPLQFLKALELQTAFAARTQMLLEPICLSGFQLSVDIRVE